MAHKPPLEEGELQSLNYRSIKTWIAANKGKLKAPPDKTVLYSGRDYDLEKLEEKLPSGADRDEFMGTPMYKVVAAWQKSVKDTRVGVGFKTLPDVLKGMKDYPKIVDKDRKEVPYPNAWVFFDDLEKTKDLEALLPNRKKIATEAWRELSDIFASNAVGDIKIFDRAADDYGKLKEDKSFILRELPALLRNPNLSQEAKDLLSEKISKYGSYFDRRYTELMDNLKAGRKSLNDK